jgi:hypothetical protein
MVKHVMERKLHKITILPAIFLEKRNDKYLVRCLVGEVTQDVLFDSFSLEGMINPKYLYNDWCWFFTNNICTR